MQLFADLDLVEDPRKMGWENAMYQVHCYPLGNFRSHKEVAKSMKDYANDSYEMIRAKYASWGTSHYQKNELLERILKSAV